MEGQSEWIYTFDLSYSNENRGTLSTLVYSYYDSRLHAAAFEYPDDLWDDFRILISFIRINSVKEWIGKSNLPQKIHCRRPNRKD